MKRFFFPALICLILISCKKDKNCKPTIGTITGTYNFTALTYKSSSGASETNAFTDACEKDDQIIFHSDGNYDFVDAGIQCFPAGDKSGIWEVNGNSITIDGEDGAIQSFDCKTLVIITKNIYVSGDQLRFTLTKQ